MGGVKPLNVAVHVATQAIGLTIVFYLVASKTKMVGLALLVVTFVVNLYVARWLIGQLAPRELPAEREVDDDDPDLRP
jgi:hypothetical protein